MKGAFYQIVVLLLLFVAVVFLQIFLSKRENRWPGLVLPAIPFLFSLIMVLNVVLPADGSVASALVTMLIVFLISNIPTAVLLAIYFSCREGLKKKKQLDKMQIQDL